MSSSQRKGLDWRVVAVIMVIVVVGCGVFAGLIGVLIVVVICVGGLIVVVGCVY